MRFRVLLLLVFSLAGCAGMAGRQPERYFVLDASRTTAAPMQVHARVNVAQTTCASFYDTQDIVFSRAPGTRSYYQLNHWTERPPSAVHALLATRFATGSPDADYVLQTRVNEIYHEAAASPGTVHISVTAELRRADGRAVVARRDFLRSAAPTTFDATGAVAAMNDALRSLLDELDTWVDDAVRADQR